MPVCCAKQAFFGDYRFVNGLFVCQKGVNPIAPQESMNLAKQESVFQNDFHDESFSEILAAKKQPSGHGCFGDCGKAKQNANIRYNGFAEFRMMKLLQRFRKIKTKKMHRHEQTPF